jgi:hypothetical protein
MLFFNINNLKISDIEISISPTERDKRAAEIRSIIKIKIENSHFLHLFC